MSVAWLITSHTLPGQVLRLAGTLRAGSPDAVLALHHNPQDCAVDEAALAELGVLRVLPPTRVTWGDMSQQTMVLRSLSWLLGHADFDWLVLLSGQDYPIRPVAEIERSLAQAGVDGFLHTVPVTGGDEFALRYLHHWRRAPVPRAAARLPGVQVRTMPSGTWVGTPARAMPFGPELVCHRGADWFTLSRRAVEHVLRFCARRPDVLRHYARTLIPTESLVHTILANSSLTLSGDNRRFSRWEPGAPSPRTLTAADLPAAFASGFDLARKFSGSVVLDAVDEQLSRAAP